MTAYTVSNFIYVRSIELYTDVYRVCDTYVYVNPYVKPYIRSRRTSTVPLQMRAHPSPRDSVHPQHVCQLAHGEQRSDAKAEGPRIRGLCRRLHPAGEARAENVKDRKMSLLAYAVQGDFRRSRVGFTAYELCLRVEGLGNPSHYRTPGKGKSACFHAASKLDVV